MSPRPKLNPPDPGALYAAAETARQAQIRKDRLLSYVERGLVVVIEERQGEYFFNDEEIYILRHIEVLRREEGVPLKHIARMVELLRQVRRLEAELKFLRG
ncbi:MAG: MerR family transcriptional regulator [Verrucomicrobiota bacterium]